MKNACPFCPYLSWLIPSARHFLFGRRLHHHHRLQLDLGALAVSQTLQEERLGINRLSIRFFLGVREVRSLFSCFNVGSPIIIDDLIEVSSMIRILYWETALHSAEEITWHPISARQIKLTPACVLESIDPAMFKEPADNTSQSDVITHTRNVRSQAADAAHEQANFDAGLRSLIHVLDQPLC